MSEEASGNAGSVPEGLTPEEKETAKREWGQLANLLKNFPQVKSYSQTKIFARSLLGPLSRVWRVNNKIQIGAEKNGTKYVFGEGDNYTEALKLTALTVAQHNATVLSKGKGIKSGTEITDEAGQAPNNAGQDITGQSTSGNAGDGRGLLAPGHPGIDATATEESATGH